MRISLVDAPESNNEMLLQLKPAVEFIKNNKPIKITANKRTTTHE